MMHRLGVLELSVFVMASDTAADTKRTRFMSAINAASLQRAECAAQVEY